MKILVAAKNERIRKELEQIVRLDYYDADFVRTRKEVMNSICDSYSCAVLDSGICGAAGLEDLREIRKAGYHLPILVLCPGQNARERIVGLESGADECVSYPCDSEELRARIHSIMRRSPIYEPPVMTFENIRMDLTECKVTVSEQLLELNKKEYQLLEHFLKKPGAVYSTSDLMEQIWGWNSDAGIHTVWTTLSNLRRKLKEAGAQAEIGSSRNYGYCIQKKE